MANYTKDFMKSKTLLLAATLLVFPFFSRAVAEEEKIGDIVKTPAGAYMLVNVFATSAQNEAFQRDIGIMIKHSHLIDMVRQKRDEEASPEEKAKLDAKLKQMENEFSANDKVMQRIYNFSANRKFKLTFLESYLCVPLTDEEMSNLRSSKGEELNPMRIVQYNKKNVYRVKKISGTKENEELQRAIAYSVSKRMESTKLRSELAKTTDPDVQMDLSKKLGAIEKAINDASSKLKEKYGIEPKQSYIIEVSRSKLYIMLSPDELVKIEAERKNKR